MPFSWAAYTCIPLGHACGCGAAGPRGRASDLLAACLPERLSQPTPGPRLGHPVVTLTISIQHGQTCSFQSFSGSFEWHCPGVLVIRVLSTLRRLALGPRTADRLGPSQGIWLDVLFCESPFQCFLAHFAVELSVFSLWFAIPSTFWGEGLVG